MDCPHYCDNQDIGDFDSSEYDTEGMRIDARNRNFDVTTDDPEVYRYENIVRASLVNGQYTQARQKCESYGMNYELELYKFKQSR